MSKKSNARFLKYLGPVVKALQSLGYSARPKEVIALVEESIDVPDEYKERRTKSGQTVFENDVHWCRAYLAKAGYIDSSKRGVWTLTSKGRDLVINDEVANNILTTVQAGTRQAATKSEPTTDTAPIIDEDDVEEIEADAANEEYRSDALERLKTLSPAGFERFCRALLLEAGFEDVHVTGRVGDRGIDGRGTLKVNPLFSMRVAFQAKRYQETVGSSVVRDFRGAIVGRADRGLLITTGTFTREAVIEAVRDGATQIELVDGPAIVELMSEYEFGLKAVSTYRLDYDLFDTFED